MERIYHPYTRWEDYKAGFYDNCSGEEKSNLIQKGIEMFNSEKLTKENMLRVVNEWIFSCEHNLSNPAVNKIAYIGQGACCVYAGIPSTVTMELWNKLDKKTQERANLIALKTIEKWKGQNKFIQLCLNID